MRYLSLLCILLSSFPAMFSQNYRIINPDRDYYYHDMNRVIHIDSAEVLASGFRYHNYELVDFCDPVPPGFPKWLSHPITVDSSGVSIFQNDSSESIILRSNSHPADTWPLYTYPNGDYLEAEHVATDWQSLFGNFDSVKTLSLTLKDTLGNLLPSDWNGNSFLLSKNHGLIQTYNLDRFPMDTTSYPLLGLTNPKVGQVGITDRDIFDFEVGDEMQYEDIYAGGGISYDHWYKWVILNKEVFTDHFRYEVENTWLRRQEIGGPAEVTLGIDTLNLVYLTDQPAPLPFAAPRSPDELMFWYSTNSSYGGRALRNRVRVELDWDLPCWRSGLDAVAEFSVMGLGGHAFHLWSPFALTARHVPIYYNKGGVEWGTPFDFSVGLAPDLKRHITISPNPFSDKLKISLPHNLAQQVLLELCDLRGKIQLTQMLSSASNQEIKTAMLPTGVYLYRISDADGSVSTGKIIKR